MGFWRTIKAYTMNVEPEELDAGYTGAAWDRIDEIKCQIEEALSQRTLAIAKSAGRRWATVDDVNTAMPLVLREAFANLF